MNVSVDLKSQQELGSNLRKVREKKNLSQEQVANVASISVTYYAGIERGEENPTYAVLRHICKALRIKSSDIFPF